MTMQLTIIGAGAIGGTIGAHMIRAGHQVLFCDADPDHVDAINNLGLTIEGPVANFTVAARAVLPQDLPPVIEHAAIAVKSHFTSGAAEVLRDRLAPDGWLVSFQNGLTAQRLADVVGWERLIVSFVNFGADYQAPGRIMQGNIAAFRVGELNGRPGPDGRILERAPITDRVRELVAALPYAQATDNILGYLWGKEAYGAMMYAGAVSDLSIADSLTDPRWRPLMVAVAREVLAQAPVSAEGFDGFEPDDLDGSLDRLAAFNGRSAKSHSGIYRDLMVRRRKTEVDDIMGELTGPLTTYAGRIIQSIERGERTCEVANLELLAAQERAERNGRPLGAVVDIIAAPRRAPAGPLHGVPVAVKDVIDISEMVRGNGNPDLTGLGPATADAPVIARLRAAGADVFCRTALLEYAAGALHPDIPETRNPFDSRCTAGGSSGGSAALVGAGVCRVAVGTDTGGSIRLPAHYCGIVGFKPTYGAVDTAGVQPLAPSLDHVGLLTAGVAEAIAAFAVIADHPAVPALDRTPRLGVLTDLVEHPAVQAGVGAVVRRALETLQEAGVELVEISRFPLTGLLSAFDPILRRELWAIHGARASAQPGHFGPDTLRLVLASRDVTDAEYTAALADRDRLRTQVAPLYYDVDALLSPAAPYVAPATTPPIDTEEGELETLFTGPFNVTGDPAVVLPCGYADGLPIGLQLAAAYGTDQELLRTAATVEAALGFVNPFMTANQAGGSARRAHRTGSRSSSDSAH
jgi:2-dehydropantoate 2-reductase